MRIPIAPYWDKIADYYWDQLDPSTDGSIWTWLERDFRGVKRARYNEFASTSPSRWELEFECESDLTLFLLRWS
jgi:hypothetical protein